MRLNFMPFYFVPFSPSRASNWNPVALLNSYPSGPLA